MFPGGLVRCRCGVDNEVLDPLAVPATHDPYRDQAPQVPGPSPKAQPAAGSRELGPLCPRCTHLIHENPERAALTCGACGGDFVDHASLAGRISAERPHDPAGAGAHPPRVTRSEAEVSYTWCPHCGQVMTRMTFGRRSGIVVDVCHAHGTWFDGGELDAALEFVRGGGLEADLAGQPAAAIDPEARAMEARLAVELLGEGAREVQHVQDLVHGLLRTGRIV